MLPYLSSLLEPVWGPFRLLNSYLILISLGAFLSAILTFILLPKLWDHLPHDQGKALVAGSEAAKGKPTGAGILLVTFFTLVLCLVLPFSWRFLELIACLYLIMLTGYLDDRSRTPWGQLKKGLLDGIISLLAATALCQCAPIHIWFPFVKGTGEGGSFLLSPLLYIPLAAMLLWFSINAVNCSDGVDGLAGSLSLLTLFCLGGLLYGITGHFKIARYLLLPHYQDGAQWAILLYTACGMLAGYLWYNAHPSSVLMGDAGSRFLGLLIGLGSLASGNPFVLLIISPILLINGGAGLVKITLLRIFKKFGCDVRPPLHNFQNVQNPKNFATDEEFAKQNKIIRIAHHFRFPLHDQCRKNLKWSDTQVLVRFMLLQAIMTPIFILIFIKLR